MINNTLTQNLIFLHITEQKTSVSGHKKVTSRKSLSSGRSLSQVDASGIHTGNCYVNVSNCVSTLYTYTV